MTFKITAGRRFGKPRAAGADPGPEPEARSLEPAYGVALRALSRRELSESQIRQRLARKGHDPDDIDEAIERLKSNGSLNDARVAAAIVRTETGLKKRGRVRVRMQLKQAGIASEVATQAVDEAFGDIDDQALLESALAKRLKDGQTIEDDRTLQRLYRYLVSQGFESDRALKLLSARRRRRLSAAESEKPDDI